MKSTLFVCCSLLLLGLLLVAGCGGGSSVEAKRSAMTLTVAWPHNDAATRLIPRATQSLRVVVDNNAGVTATQTVDRPEEGYESTVTFPNLPVGEYAVRVEAYAEAEGAGTMLATASTVVYVTQEGGRAVVDLASTIHSLELDSYPGVMDTGDSVQLLATVFDEHGAIVPVLPQPQGFFWSTSASNIAAIDQDGTLTTVAPGLVTITAIERESGISSSVDIRVFGEGGSLNIVIVNDPVLVAIDPESPTVAPGGMVCLTATVTGVPNQHVSWQVTEEHGGTVNTDGVYIAPQHEGIYHVTAVSTADASRIGVATITVEQGGVDQRPRIVYMAARDSWGEDYDLCAIDPDGTNQRQLTTDVDLMYYQPHVSPDGTKIVCTSGRMDASEDGTDILLMNADGSNQRTLSAGSPGTNMLPSFSPDGKRILFTSHRNGQGQLFTMNLSGGQVTQVRSGFEVMGDGRYSADGSKIVFIGILEGEDWKSNIYMMNADGTNNVLLHDDEDNRLALPSFSPNRSTIAFSRSDYENDTWKVFLIDANGHNLRPLSTSLYESHGGSFSPDGQQYICSGRRSEGADSSLFLVDIATGAATELNTDAPNSVYEPFWARN